MQKKFWSALLSLAMIVSCFSGVTMAAVNAKDVGAPTYQLSSPNNTNIDMYGASRTTVVFTPNTGITLSGRLTVQGNEDNVQYMTTARVADLYKKITGNTASTPADQTLVFGLLNNPAERNTSQYATERWYMERAYSSPNSISKTKSSILVSRFAENSASTSVDSFLTVDSDGRFTMSFVPEVHTTRYIGFGIKSLGQRQTNGEWVFPYETSDSVSGGANQAAVDAALDAYNVATAAYTAYENTNGSVVTSLTASKSTYKANEQALVSGEADYQTALALVTSLTAVKNTTYGPETSATQTAYSTQVGKLAAIKAIFGVFDNSGDLAYAYDQLMNVVSTAYDTAANSVITLAGTAINAAYFSVQTMPAIVLANATTEYNNAVDDAAYQAAGATAYGAAEMALNAQLSLTLSLEAPYLAAKAAEDALDVEIAAASADALAKFNLWQNAASYDFAGNATAIAALELQVKSYNTELARLDSVMTSAYTAYQTALASQGGTGNPVQSTVENRLMQGSPIEIRFQYKVRDGSQSIPSGTTNAQTISGYIVDANGNAPERDFDYVVHTTSAPKDTSTQVASGRTSGGYYVFTLNNVGTQTFYLFPTQRFTSNTQETDRDANGMVPISVFNAETRYPYTVASGSRQAFYKAELENSSAISNVTYMEVQFSDLYTYDTDNLYNVITRSGNKASIFMYGVSYALYVPGLGYISKGYSIKDASQNVTSVHDDGVGDWFYSSTPYIIDGTSAGDSTPPLGLNSEGKLTFDDNVVEVCFTGTGTASIRVRANHRTEASVIPTEGYQSIVTISVDSPGLVAHTGGTELKKVNYYDETPFVITLISTADAANAIAEVRMNKIRYPEKSEDEHTLVYGDASYAKDTQLSYQIAGDIITIYVPWNLVTTGGSNLELDLDFLTGGTTQAVVTSKTVSVKNSLWKVTSSVETLSVNSANSFYAFVTDGEDVEQNRAALVVVDDSGVQIGSNRSYNVVGGQYTFENVRPSRGGDVYIVVKESSSSDDVKTLMEIQAVGLADYTATMVEGKENAVTGLSSPISFSVVNASGSAATDLTTVQVLNSDGKKTTNFHDYEKLTLSHNGNGTYTVNVIAFKPGSYILRVSTNNMTHYVDVFFEVLPLEIEFADTFTALTWDYSYGKNADFRNSNKLDFTVKNPLTGADVYAAIDSSKFELVTEDGEVSDLVANMATSVSPYPNARLTLTDADYNTYLVNNTSATHSFYVGLVDTRSASVRNAEGDLALKFYLIVKDGNSTGTPRTVEGFDVPIKLPTLTSDPEFVQRATTTSVDLFVHDANGNPVVGIQLRTDAEDMAARTDAEGKTTYLFTPLETGSSKRFDITGFVVDQFIQYDTASNLANITLKSQPVYATVRIVNDIEAPVITLNPYVGETIKDYVTISGTIQDDGGLDSVNVNSQSRKYSGQTSADFTFDIDLRKVGDTEIVIIAADKNGNEAERVVTVTRKNPTIITLTIGTTEATKNGAVMGGLDVLPTVIDGTTYLPIRFIFETLLNGTVDFDAATQTISASVMGSTVVMQVGSNIAVVDGKNVVMPGAPFIEAEAGRTLAPIRYPMQELGIIVDYNETNGMITLTGAGDEDVIVYPENDAVIVTEPEDVVTTTDEGDEGEIEAGDGDDEIAADEDENSDEGNSEEEESEEEETIVG